MLRQLVGEWEFDSEATLAPGQPPVRSRGTETVRAIGEAWIVAESRGTLADAPFQGVMTLGYDAEQRKVVGTWIDSVSDRMLHYVGTLDAAAATLTLYTEGPNPTAPGRPRKFKDVIQLESADHKTLTSYTQGDDGRWIPFVSISAWRRTSPYRHIMEPTNPSPSLN